MLFVLTYVPLWQQLSFIRITSNFVNIVFFSLKISFSGMFFRPQTIRKQPVDTSNIGFKAQYADVNFI